MAVKDTSAMDARTTVLVDTDRVAVFAPGENEPDMVEAQSLAFPTLKVGTPAQTMASTAVGLHISRTGSGSATIVQQTESTSGVHSFRASANSSGPIQISAKCRGTWATFAAAQQNDILGDRTWNLISAIAAGVPTHSTAARQRVRIVSASPSASDLETDYTISLCQAGGTTPTDVLALKYATGLSLYANVVVDNNRHFRLRSYTVATLPSASPAGMMIYVSDGTSNKRLAVSDATNWRWPDGAVVT